VLDHSPQFSTIIILCYCVCTCVKGYEPLPVYLQDSAVLSCYLSDYVPSCDRHLCMCCAVVNFTLFTHPVESIFIGFTDRCALCCAFTLRLCTHTILVAHTSDVLKTDNSPSLRIHVQCEIVLNRIPYLQEFPKLAKIL
jgi:hypothetical protein